MTPPIYGQTVYARLSVPNGQQPAIYGGQNFDLTKVPPIRWEPLLRTYYAGQKPKQF